MDERLLLDVVVGIATALCVLFIVLGACICLARVSPLPPAEDKEGEQQ